jgi:hypothetical protein
VAVIIGTALDIANIIKGSQAYAHTALLVLLENRDAVLRVTKPVGVAANGFVEVPFTGTDAALFVTAQGVETAQILAFVKRHIA